MNLPCLKRDDASTGGEVVEFEGGRGEEGKKRRRKKGPTSALRSLTATVTL